MSDSSKRKRIKPAKKPHRNYGSQFPGPAMIFFEAVRLEHQLSTGKPLNKSEFARLLGMSRQNYNGYVLCANPRMAHLILLVEKGLVAWNKLWEIAVRVYKRAEYRHLFNKTETEE